MHRIFACLILAFSLSVLTSLLPYLYSSLYYNSFFYFLLFVFRGTVFSCLISFQSVQSLVISWTAFSWLFLFIHSLSPSLIIFPFSPNFYFFSFSILSPFYFSFLSFSFSSCRSLLLLSFKIFFF